MLISISLNSFLVIFMTCSGDVDGRVPVTSTLASLAKMRLTVKTPWHPWFHGGEVFFSPFL